VAGKYAAGVFMRDGAKRTMKKLDENFAKNCGVTNYEFLGDELRVDISVDEGDIIQAGDMEFRVINLPGHTRCCVGFYCEKEGLLLAAETLGVYDGEKTVMPIYLVSYCDTISSIEKIEKLNITKVLAPHYGLLNAAQTEFYLKNMKPGAGQTAQEILDSIKNGLSDEEIIKQYKNKYWQGYMKEIYPVDAIELNTSIMIRLIKTELM
jgi:glyoxylase-like metal-dependent hydrolase (beta-lactamase superfamily II)